MTGRRARAAVLSACALLAAGCGSPVGVRLWSLDDAYRQSYANALTEDRPTAFSVQALLRLGLYETWQENPSAALAELHQSLQQPQGNADRLFALAELSLLEARKTKDSGRFLAAAVYAWAFLVREDGVSKPIPLDPRNRIAADVYNASLAKAFALPWRILNDKGEPAGDQEDKIVLKAGVRRLPFGELAVEAPDRFFWAGREFGDFVSAVQYDVKGLRNRYREPGIGAPLIATLAKEETSGASAAGLVPESSRLPVTALLRLEDVRGSLGSGRLRGTLEVHPWTDRTVELGGMQVPLEFETTAALGYALKDAPVFQWEIGGFFGMRNPVFRTRSGNLATVGPYRRGAVPVVLVHGTASSPIRWAELLNELMADDRIASRYQFWLFTYNTGEPIALNAGVLRKALADAIAEFDPQGSDDALRHMVVIGHSQGGLLAKLTAIDSGDRFWRNASDKPLEELDLTPATKALLERSLFFTRLPFVERVVFICTPHRGSYLASGRISRWIAKLVKVPGNVLSTMTELAHAKTPDQVQQKELLAKVPRSVDNMNPTNPFIQTLASIPVAPPVRAYSIVAVKGDGPLAEETDGVVAYTSAHIEEAVSEKIIRWNHSVQAHPEAIEEVRRILLEAGDGAR